MYRRFCFIAVLAILTTSAAAVELLGYCFLDDQSTFAGTMVVFIGFEIWYVTDTTYTDANGFFRIDLPPDAYDIHYTHPGYLDWWETASAFTGTVVLPTVNLQPLPGAPLTGALNGTLPYDHSYVVWDSIWIQERDTLIIEPGVEIYFADSATFAVFGMLQAVGSYTYPGDSIRFLRLPTQFPTPWGGIRFYDSASDCCKLDHCLVQGGMNGFGGGIHIENADICISNSIIRDNAGGEGASQGGGIYVTEASPRIVNCLIAQNSAAHGGGLYCYNASPELTNCVFDNNTAEMHGGGIYLLNADPAISNCHFTNNIGGGMFCASSNPGISSCDFYNNSGSAIGMDNASPVIDECFFYANSGGLGGAINCFSNSNPTVNACNLFGNTSTLGGAVYIAESHPYLDDCTIENNVSSQFGGGVFVDPFSGLIIENCSFEGNSAPWGGGLANLSGAPLSLVNCDFAENEAIKGGGLYNEHAALTLANCQFSANHATERGGGIALQAFSALLAEGCDFIQNSSQTNGGGIHCEDQGSIVALDCDFQANSAELSGGGIYGIEASSLTLTGCNFVENLAGLSGGAVRDSSFVGPTITRCLFQGNSAGINGGGIAIDYGVTSLLNCTMAENSCGGSGSGIYLLHPNVTRFSNTVFAQNSNYGIYLSNPYSLDSIFVRYCDFFANDSGAYYFFPPLAAPVGLGELDTVNFNQDSCDVYGNIYLDPLFTDPLNGFFTLQANSPCIDAGDPQAPWDPDSTIADIGAFSFEQPAAVVNHFSTGLPTAFCLHPVYPNPFNPTTEIRYQIPDASQVSLRVYDAAGRLVETLLNGWRLPGAYQATFDGSSLPSGVYLYRLEEGEYQASGKMVLLK